MMTPEQAEPHVHDVLNVFMCTGFTRDTNQYFMKASPVRPGDYIEFVFMGAYGSATSTRFNGFNPAAYVHVKNGFFT